MQADSHQHFCQYDVQRRSWITDEVKVLKRDYLPPDLLPERRANGMAGSIAVQADQSEQETDFLLELADWRNWPMQDLLPYQPNDIFGLNAVRFYGLDNGSTA